MRSRVIAKLAIFGRRANLPKLAMVGLLLMAAGSVFAGDSPNGERVDLGERPAFCQKGYVCIKTETAADLLIKLDFLQAQVDTLKATRRKPFGWALACGPAASFSTTDSGTTMAGTLSCAIGYGIRF